MKVNHWQSAMLAILMTGLLAVGVVQAQLVRSAILGTITDESGLVVPGVTVAVTNLATNVSQTIITDDTGNYMVPFLDPGEYRVSAVLTGFKKAVEPRAQLDVATRLRVDLTLPVGDPNEVVEVRSAVPLVQTDDTAVGLHFKEDQLKSLPLLGRNYQSLALLSPTAVNPITNILRNFNGANLTGGNWFQVAGQRGSDAAYDIDGIDANHIMFQTQSLIPSLDSIQEFKLQTHNYSSEYGRGSVQFTTITKSGSNQFHGAIYNYNRNAIFNANNFFSNRTGRPRQPFNHNQFGANLGGPIWRDKTFFFFAYEGQRLRQTRNAAARTPPSEYLQGDFSNFRHQLYDPLTVRRDENGRFIRDPFPGNQIPRSRFSVFGAAAAALFPAPNAKVGTLVGNQNLTGTIRRDSDVNYWTVRIDHTFSERDSLYGRYMQSRETLTSTGAPVQLLAPLSGDFKNNDGYNLMIAETHTFTPRIINELRYGYNQGYWGIHQEGGTAGCHGPCDESIDYITDVFGIKNLAGPPSTYGLPVVVAAREGRFGGNINAPHIGEVKTHQISNTLSVNSGTHSVKTGVDLRFQNYNHTAAGGFNRGLFIFNGRFTTFPGTPFSRGNSAADLLLGNTHLVLGTVGQLEALAEGNQYSFFIQDDMRLFPNLTLNLGLRYEYYPPWVENSVGASRFDFVAAPGTCFENTNPCPPTPLIQTGPGETFYDPDYNNFGPRIGLAYSPFGDRRMVIRAAYGIFYSPAPGNDIINSLGGVLGSQTYTKLPNHPFTDVTTTDTANPDLFPQAPFTRADFPIVTGPDYILPPGVGFRNVSRHLPTALIQHWQLTLQREILPNLMLELGYIGSHGYNGNRRTSYNQAQPDRPGELTGVNSRRPYPQIGGITQIEHTSHNTYNAGVVRVERRFEKGLSLTSSYTFSRTIDDFGDINGPTLTVPMNSYNLRLDKGLAAHHAKHRFTAGYNWELPFGRGRRIGSSMHPVLDGVLGGWQFGGITIFQSGNPLHVRASADFSNTGQSARDIRPNKVGEVRYFNPRKSNFQWANIDDAFEHGPRGTFGNTGRGEAIGPGINNWNLMLAKNFAIGEYAKLQVRVEMFNAWNHTQWGTPNSVLNGPLTGFVTSTRAPRVGQVALRLDF